MSNERVEILTVAECRELLTRHRFGRFGFIDSVGVLPSIIPVNYLLDNDKIVIRTDAGSKLAAALRGAPVAFEVDGVDETHQVGWSVVVRGHAEEITDEDTIAELRRRHCWPGIPEPNPAIYESTRAKSSADASKSPTSPPIGGDSSQQRPIHRPGGLIEGTQQLARARTAGFTVLVFCQLFNCFNARSETTSAFRHLFVNRWLWGAIALSAVLQIAVVHIGFLNVAFGTVPLSWDQWLVCIAMGSVVLWFSELRKLLARSLRRSPTRLQ